MPGSESVIRNLKAYQNRVIAGSHALAESYALRAEAHAKQTGPWTDQTGAARKTIFGSVTKDEKRIVVWVSHQMEYGPYLELSRHGKYAVLKPTVARFRDQFFRDLRRVVTGK